MIPQAPVNRAMGPAADQRAESDLTLSCIVCRRPFTWSRGEQAWFRARGLQQPKRCPACRRIRRPHYSEAPEAYTPVPGGPTRR